MYKVAVAVLLVCLSARVCWCQCQSPFLDEPDTVSGSPITCNILGAEVAMNCRVEVGNSGSVAVGWFFTTEMDEAGIGRPGETADRLQDNDPRFLFRSITGFAEVTNNLVIRSYDATYEGFYWCGATSVTNTLPSAMFNPSRVVRLGTAFTTAQLPTCRAPVTLTRVGRRCAYGDMEASLPRIVPGAEFTNIRATTTPEPPVTTTQAPPTTATTKAPYVTTTAGITTVEATQSGSNTVRTAVIWFSVGAAVFVLIVIAVILCIVAWVKC